MALTRIKTNNILDRQVFSNDLADSVVTFEKIQITGTASAGDVLKVNGSGELIFEPATGTATNLNALTDVNIVAPQNFDSLVYNDITGNWEASSKTSSSVSLASLSDTTFVFPLQQGQYLGWDGNTWRHQFIYANQIIGLGDQEFTSVIDQMADVDTTTTTPISGDALVWNGVDNWEPFAIAGLGASSNTFVVADLTAMGLLSASEGDQAFVRSGSTTGEWEMYLWDAAWILISNQDSASTDAKTIEALVVPATVSPVLLGNVSPDSRVTIVTIEVTVAFDGAPTLSVGDAGDNARLIDDSLHDLSEIGTYSTTTDYVYSGGADTDVNGYFSASGATVGSARILVTYV